MTIRKPRSDSVTAALRAFQAGPFSPPAHITLREKDRPFWDAAIACRSDWNESELPMVAGWARAMADGEQLHREIAEEGVIVKGRTNIKFRLAEMLSRRAMALARHLQIHARATRGEARQAARQPKGWDDSAIGCDLLARPQ